VAGLCRENIKILAFDRSTSQLVQRVLVLYASVEYQEGPKKYTTFNQCCGSAKVSVPGSGPGF
jgi:hypothetical protein